MSSAHRTSYTVEMTSYLMLWQGANSGIESHSLGHTISQEDLVEVFHSSYILFYHSEVGKAGGDQALKGNLSRK